MVMVMMVNVHLDQTLVYRTYNFLILSCLASHLSWRDWNCSFLFLLYGLPTSFLLHILHLFRLLGHLCLIFRIWEICFAAKWRFLLRSIQILIIVDAWGVVEFIFLLLVGAFPLLVLRVVSFLPDFLRFRVFWRILFLDDSIMFLLCSFPPCRSMVILSGRLLGNFWLDDLSQSRTNI